MEGSKPLVVLRRTRLTLNLKHNFKHPQPKMSRGENSREPGLGQTGWLSPRELLGFAELG